MLRRLLVQVSSMGAIIVLQREVSIERSRQEHELDVAPQGTAAGAVAHSDLQHGCRHHYSADNIRMNSQ